MAHLTARKISDRHHVNVCPVLSFILLCIQKECLVSLISFVYICLACNLPRCMHAENRYAAVDYFHFIKSSNISDGSAAAHIYLAKLCSLEKYIVIVENLADSCHILSVSIIGTGFSCGLQ